MKISKITILNFRSIEKAEIEPNLFNVFVGQNNHGKTNIFEAIEWFYQGTKGTTLHELKFRRDASLEVQVIIEFIGVQEGADKMVNETNKTKIKALIGNAEKISVKRSSLEEKKRYLIVNGQQKPPGTGFDSALNDFLPKFEYVSTKHYYETVAKFGKTTPIGIMLSGVLAAILEENEKYKQFHEKFRELFEDDSSEIKIQFDNLGGKVKYYLQKQFPDTTKVKFEVSPPQIEDLLKSFDTTIDDGVETNASEKGDGMQRALMLAIIQAYAEFRRDREDIGKSFIFFIDEAELHLHPSAQRKLKNVLIELSKNTDQVFINTHSSVFIADNDDCQEIFKVEKEEKATSVTEVKDEDKPYIIYELLGGSPTDLLLPHNFLLVEGPSEVELLKRLIIRFYSDKPKIHILPCRGDLEKAEKSIDAIETTFTALEKTLYSDKLVLLYDNPHESKLTACDQFFKKKRNLIDNNQSFRLPVGSLEEYYPSIWNRTSDEVRGMSGKQKISLAKVISTTISQDEFEASMPIVFQALQKCWESSFGQQIPSQELEIEIT